MKANILIFSVLPNAPLPCFYFYVNHSLLFCYGRFLIFRICPPSFISVLFHFAKHICSYYLFMGAAAVLRPQDCLTSPQRRGSRSFLYRTTGSRLEVNSSSLHYVGSGTVTDYDLRGFVYDRGLLGCKNASTGLLPLPDHLVQRDSSPFHRNLRVGELREPSSNQFRIRNQQKSWMPYDRRALIGSRNATWPRLPPASSHTGNIEVSLPLGTRAELPYQELNMPSKSRNNWVVKSKRLHHGDNCIAYFRKKGISGMERLGTSTDDKLTPAVEEGLMCRASGRRLGQKWQLRRSFSEKFVDNVPVASLRNCNREKASEDSVANFPKDGTSQMKDVLSQTNCVRKCGDVSGDNQFYITGSANMVLSCGEFNNSTSACRLEYQEYDTQEMLISNMQGLSSEDKFAGGMNNGGSILLARASSTVADKSVLRSSDDSEKWAGPSFVNSPAPSCLPVPSFTMKLSKAMSTSLVTTVATAQMCSNTVLEVKRSWDTAFATEDLRRLLHLDHTC